MSLRKQKHIISLEDQPRWFGDTAEFVFVVVLVAPGAPERGMTRSPFFMYTTRFLWVIKLCCADAAATFFSSLEAFVRKTEWERKRSDINDTTMANRNEDMSHFIDGRE